VTYTVNYLDVYKNGSKLLGADITATNGTSFTIAACAAGDIVQAVVYDTVSIAAGPTGPTGSVGPTGSSGPTGPTGSGMTYPAAGIANSTGTAWGTSYSTSGSGTVVALATGASLVTPSLDAETFTTSATVTAGTNAQGQGALTSDFNVITTTSNNPSGVTLPTATTGRRVIIVNKGTNPISVYPATGGQIDTQGTNTALIVAVGNFVEFNASSTTQWYSTVNNVTPTEVIYTPSDSVTVDINPSNGTIQYWVLTANRTFTATNFKAGQSVTMMMSAGSSLATWPSVTWVGGTAPTLSTTGLTIIELWKYSSTIYGANVGNA